MKFSPPGILADEDCHRDRRPIFETLTIEQIHLAICVARAVPRSEYMSNPLAQAAVQKEWDRLRVAQWSSKEDGVYDQKGVWDEKCSKGAS